MLGLPRVVVAITAIAVLGGCGASALVGSNVGHGDGGGGNTSGVAADSTGAASTVVESGEDSHGETHAEDTGSSTTDDVRFDVGFTDVPAACEAPMLQSCDARESGPWHALGLQCPGDAPIEGSYSGDPQAMIVHHGLLGTSGVFAPREGERFVILSTGDASQLAHTPEQLAIDNPPCFPAIACPSTAHGGPAMPGLPPPIDVRRVSDKGLDCTAEPSLVGTGDCSNTLWDQWLDGQSAVDYAELRLSMVAPEDVDGFSYDFAFFSAEYPSFTEHETSYNDMYVAWLESEKWTGNISFDEMGNPITANGVFLDYKGPSTACPDTCDAPELAGFAMEGHAGTKWLVTNAPVQGGEKLSLVFAIFDMRDGFYDSAVILDNFQWTCSGAPPFTAPG
jgi:hypothetical protein